MKVRLVVFLFWCSIWSWTPLALGQSDKPAARDAEDCDRRAAQEKVLWGKTKHGWLSSVFHKQDVETKQTWCHIWAARGYDHVHAIEDFGRVLYTGEGIHPTLGSIVPGSGLGGGLALNLERATANPPIRYSGNIEARGSINGFWEAGGRLNLLGAAETRNDEHIHATLFATHASLPKLTYFGLGNASAPADESVYGIDTTNARAAIDVPLPAAFTISALSEGLWANPTGNHDSHLPSIEQLFTPADTPALNTSTTSSYMELGLSGSIPRPSICTDTARI